MPEYTLQDITAVQAELEENYLVDISDAQVELGSDAIQLIAPENGAVGVSISPTFSWNALPDISTYIVRVWDYTGDVKGNLIVLRYTSNTEFTVPEPLQNSTKYLWQIVKATLINATEPEPATEITGISISAGSTITVGGSRTFTITTTGTGDYDPSYTVSGAGLTFSISGDQLTVTESGGVADDTKYFTVEAVADNTVTDSRPLTLVNETAIATNDSVQTDFEALQAFYNGTQGNGIPTLANAGELPPVFNATYPYMYNIGGNIHYLERDAQGAFIGWVDAGSIWTDKTGWDSMTAQTMGDAVGVTVDEDGRVTEIDMQKVMTEPYDQGVILKGNVVAGTLAPEIGNLKRLKKLNIKQNFFHGSIPSEIKYCTESVRLSFAGQNNELQVDYDNRYQWHEGNHWYEYTDLKAGETRNIGKKIVATNRFQTELPAGIDGFQNLELFECRNQYLQGVLPAWSTMPSLTAIFIDGIYGSASNTMHGAIPSSWGGLTNVIFLDLYQRNRPKIYSGEIPSTLNNWTGLTNLKLEDNAFEGQIPEFLNARDKRYILLSRNKFTGGFPSGYFNGDNSQLSKFGIGFNNLGGSIPEMTTDDTTPIYPPSHPETRDNYGMSAPGMNSANLTGDFPEWFASMRAQVINITGNSFTGDFPEGIMTSDRMKTVYINGNQFSSPLPKRSWGPRKISWFYMGGNDFTGEIPDEWRSILLNESNDLGWSGYQSFTGTGATLTWSAITGADGYEVELLDSSGSRYDYYGYMTTESLVLSELPSDTYQWRVRGLVWTGSISRYLWNDMGLSGRIPDWFLNVPSIDYLWLNENKFSFKDIGPIYSAFNAHNINNLALGNQKPFGEPQSQTASLGGNITFDLSEFGYTNNQYQWLKNASPISNNTKFSGATTPALTISDITIIDEGEYRLQVDNPDMPDIGTQLSEIITLTT